MSKEDTFKYVGAAAIIIAGCVVGKLLVATMDHNTPSDARLELSEMVVNVSHVSRPSPFRRLSLQATVVPPAIDQPAMFSPFAHGLSPVVAEVSPIVSRQQPAAKTPAVVATASSPDNSTHISMQIDQPAMVSPFVHGLSPVVAEVSPIVSRQQPAAETPAVVGTASSPDNSTHISMQDLEQLTTRLESQIAAGLSRLHDEQLTNASPSVERDPESMLSGSASSPASRDDVRRPLTLAQRTKADAAIQQVESRAAALVMAGLDAGRRNATFTARDKMLDALRLVAQAADMASDSRVRTTMLTQGMVALEESTDFAKDADVFNDALACERVVATHRSRVVTEEDARQLTHLSLQRAYLEYSQQKLIAAADGSRAGAAALVGLAKFYLGRAVNDGLKREGPRAVALCQAAMTVDPNNHDAANELGALLAQYGRLPEAKEMLLRSLRGQPTVSGWHNLSIVHSRLGESELAKLAAEERAALELNDSTYKNRMGFVDKETFASTHPDADPAGLPGRAKIDDVGMPARATQPASSAQSQTAGMKHWRR